MTTEIRPCSNADELKAYRDVVGYVFAVNDAADLDNEVRNMSMDWTMCGFVDGKLVSSYAAFPFTTRLNGRPVAMGGVTAVGTLPGYRRQGLLRKTMTAGLRAMGERGQAFAILWASMGAIYQRFGYGLASPYVLYRFDPAAAGLRPGVDATGQCDLEQGEKPIDVLRPIYAAYAERRNLAIDRPAWLWEHGPFRVSEKRRIYTAVYRNDEGEATGYVVYTTFEDEARAGSTGPEQVLEVKDIAWLDVDAYIGIWKYLCNHDLVYEVRMRGLVGLDDPIPALMLEPRMVHMEVFDGIWMRVVDIETGLTQRPYAEAGALTIELVDDLLPWNAGRRAMETDGETTTVTSTSRDADLVMPVATLASLIAGHRSATFCERAGLLEAPDRAALRRADRMFATTYAPFTPNDF